MRRSGRPSITTSSTLLWIACAALAIVAACSPFGSSGGGLAPDAGTGAIDGGDAGALVEAGSELDSGDGGADADASGPACSSDVVLIGTDVHGVQNVKIPTGSVDAYGFAAPAIATVTARCAKVYVADLGTVAGGDIVFGVYTDGGVKPGERLAATKLSNVKVGWNAAELDHPVVIGPGQTLWLALTPTNGEISIRANVVCVANQDARMTRSGLAAGALPNPFNHNDAGLQCGATLFLAP